MIKQILVFILALFLCGISYSQNSTAHPDSRLLECFSAAEIEQMENTQPELIRYYNYYLDHSYYTVSLNLEKPVTGKDIHSLTLRNGNGGFQEKSFEAAVFNPLKYNLNLEQNSFTTYIWKEAGIALVFYPLSHIAAGFKASSEKK